MQPIIIIERDSEHELNHAIKDRIGIENYTIISIILEKPKWGNKDFYRAILALKDLNLINNK